MTEYISSDMSLICLLRPPPNNRIFVSLSKDVILEILIRTVCNVHKHVRQTIYEYAVTSPLAIAI